MSSLLSHRKFIGAALVVVVLVTMMSVTARERERISHLEAWILEMVAPLQKAAATGASWFTANVQAISEWRRMKDELTELRAEVGRYRSLEHEYQEVLAENSRLSRLLGLANRYPVMVTTARVIGRNPDNWFSTIVLDRGANHGVKRHMAAVTDRGVIGRVIRVTPNTSTVLLLTDPSSGVGAMVMRSRDPGVVLGLVGSYDRLTMQFFTRDADVEVGDTIITSGLGSVFPKGLVIGRVVSVFGQESQLTMTAVVETTADLRRLEEVMILLTAGGDLLGEEEVVPEPTPSPNDVPGESP